MSILLGTHTFDAKGEGGRRQAAALASFDGLTGVEIVNVQFADAPHEAGGLRTLAVLTQDSTAVTGRAGARKPLVSEVLAALAAEASALGLPHFCFTNADIHFSQDAVDAIRHGSHEGCILFREDYDGATGESLGLQLGGVDALALSTAWWGPNRWRFRPYILGEPAWDNVYTAIVLCHADAVVENRRGLLRHEAHGSAWTSGSPFAEYTRLLAAQDAGYFHLWCVYWDALARMRAEGADAEREAELVRRVFLWHPSLAARTVQAGRSLKARLRYGWRRGRD